jgi:hypothetical protein
MKEASHMPKVSKETATQGGDYGPVADQTEEFSGYTVSFVQFRESIDHRPLFKGLPDDRCQCPHWGYIIRGRWTLRYADHDEVYEAGEAFYAPAGHTPIENEPGTEVLLFSPSEEQRATDAAIQRNMQALETAAAG